MTARSFELSNLPFEIASIISKNLDVSSLANCCLVNKHWYACFISSVWESPNVNGLGHLKSIHQSLESISSIMNEEEETTSFSDSYNHLKMIKHLDLTTLVDECDANENENVLSFDYADTKTKSLLTDFSTHCSNLKSLALKVPSEKNSSKDAPNFFFTLRQYAKTALSLESLTLDFNDMTVFAEHLQESIPIECFTKLHTLNLQNATMVDDSAFIWLWSNCPSLTSVTISQSSNLNDYILNPLIRIHADKLKVFNLERCSRLSINSLLNIIVSCKNLEQLRWVNNGASFNNRLLSNYSSDFEVKDMAQFMKALKENCVVDHLKELDYAFLQLNKASVIFDFLIEKNRECLESIKCDTSNALISAAQNNITFPHLKEVSYNNKSTSLKELSCSLLQEQCKVADSVLNSVENSNNITVTV
ncbi:hypothetical protein BCR36DRAFT_585852 [Piromyces finnis]|uniref:F-box domain-containing protein n=1 Tax=Piromyces finnis TaxID=1754191 RepID=A0A1Y1V3U4_9FUNG|nr:hypothetical protein BCR36DRAFT_585852 [Piromyces finnis]|eukprot:ORX45247.1 hypothetical protein BCR36DRAFT_585852 [Piromyces finnis]